MFIYNGKFNWASGETEASNEMITIVFPVGFALNDPVSAYWQWSNSPLVNKKAGVSNAGVVNSVTATVDGSRRIHSDFGYYPFDVTIAADEKTLSLTTHNTSGRTFGPFTLSAMHIDPSKTTCTVFTGTLKFLEFAKADMTTLVVLDGITKGALFGLYHQWTVDPKGVQKGNHCVNGRFERIKSSADGSSIALFEDEDFKYEFKFGGNLKDGSLKISAQDGSASEDSKFALTYKV